MRVFIAFLMLMAGISASAQNTSRSELQKTNTAILGATTRNSDGRATNLTTIGTQTNLGPVQFVPSGTATFRAGASGSTYSIFDNISGITWFSYDHATDKLTETLGTHEVVGTIKAQVYQAGSGSSGTTVTTEDAVFEDGLLISGSLAGLRGGGGEINVTHAPYNAVGDAITNAFATTFSNSTYVQLATTNALTSSDVGKYIEIFGVSTNTGTYTIAVLNIHTNPHPLSVLSITGVDLTWTNGAPASTNYVQTTNSTKNATTNLYAALRARSYTNITPSLWPHGITYANATNLYIRGNPGSPLTVTPTGVGGTNWASVTYITNTYNQDLAAYITGVTNGTNIAISRAAWKSATLTNAIYGTDNSVAVQKATDKLQTNGLNGVVYLPAARYPYLLIGTNSHITGPQYNWAVGVTGNVVITFRGDGVGTVLMPKSAWSLQTGVVSRGSIFSVIAPSPEAGIVLEDVTLFGGHGLTTVNGFPANTVTGEGWDQTHRALNMAWSSPIIPRLTARRVRVHGFLGEAIYDGNCCGDSGATIEDSDFYNNNASAINLNRTITIRGNRFWDNFIIGELGLSNTRGRSEFSDNWGSNNAGGVVFNVSETNHNDFSVFVGRNHFIDQTYGVVLAGAKNLRIEDNTSTNVQFLVSANISGAQGNDPRINHDIYIGGNQSLGPQTYAVYINGWLIDSIVEGNYGEDYLISGYGTSSNVTLLRNLHGRIDPILLAQPLIDDGSHTNNTVYDSASGTVIQYQLGRNANLYKIYAFGTNADVQVTNNLPVGALLHIEVTSGVDWLVLTNANVLMPGNRQLSAGGDYLDLEWDGTYWFENAYHRRIQADHILPIVKFHEQVQVGGVSGIGGGNARDANGNYYATNSTGIDAGAGAGSGDFVGPGSATDNAIVRFDGTTGKLGQNSGVIVSDTTNVTGVQTLTANAVSILDGGVAPADGVYVSGGQLAFNKGGALAGYFDNSARFIVSGAGGIRADSASDAVGGNIKNPNGHPYVTNATGIDATGGSGGSSLTPFVRGGATTTNFAIPVSTNVILVSGVAVTLSATNVGNGTYSVFIYTNIGLQFSVFNAPAVESNAIAWVDLVAPAPASPSTDVGWHMIELWGTPTNVMGRYTPPAGTASLAAKTVTTSSGFTNTSTTAPVHSAAGFVGGTFISTNMDQNPIFGGYGTNGASGWFITQNPNSFGTNEFRIDWGSGAVGEVFKVHSKTVFGTTNRYVLTNGTVAASGDNLTNNQAASTTFTNKGVYMAVSGNTSSNVDFAVRDMPVIGIIPGVDSLALLVSNVTSDRLIQLSIINSNLATNVTVSIPASVIGPASSIIAWSNSTTELIFKTFNGKTNVMFGMVSPPTITNNFVSGQLYTNIGGLFASVSATIRLTNLLSTDFARMSLWLDEDGDGTFEYKGINTSLGGVALVSDTAQLVGHDLPPGCRFAFTNDSGTATIESNSSRWKRKP